MLPTEYEIQKIAVLRELIHKKEALQNFKRLERGVEGEDKLYQYLLEFGLKHWVILRNKWFRENSAFECDFILITSHAIYVFEVKNYYGKFVYENGQSFSRDVPITYNPINQARNTTIHLQNILHQYLVKGVLVFIGDHNHVCIKDEIKDINILETNDVYNFIQAIKQEEKFSGLALNMKDIQMQFERYEIDPPYLPKPYSRKEMIGVNTGIFCVNCQQKVLVSRSQYISCSCGFHESKEEAIIRTACEYGVLTYDRDFKISDIRSFIDNQASTVYLRKVLSKHFDNYNKHTNLTLRNPGQCYSVIEASFKFELPKIMVINKESDTHLF